MSEDPKWYPEYYHAHKAAVRMQNHHISNNRTCTDPQKHNDKKEDGGDYPKWKIEYQRMKPTERLSGIPKEYDK